jgi:hypothetical protein
VPASPAKPSGRAWVSRGDLIDLLIASLWSFGLAVVLTWPAIIRPGEAALGHARADGMKHLWTLWWMQASVWQEGQFPFSTHLINFPIGMDLYPIEPLNGLLAVMLPFLSVVSLSNVLIFINMTLTGIAGMWFGKELSGSRFGGLVAGTLLEGSSVMAFFVHVGVGELTHLWWLPLGLGLLIRARRTGHWAWFLALAAALVGAMLSCFYLGFFLSMSVAIYALSTLYDGRRTPKLLALYVLAAGLAVGTVYPVTQWFASSYKSGDIPEVGLRSYILQEHGQPITDPPSARLEPPQLLTPFRTAKSTEDAAYGGGRYLGFLTILLALGGLVRNPRKAWPFVGVALFGVLFAFGSYLTVDGMPVTSSGARLRMPHIWLNRLLGYVAEPLNFPVRFLAMTTVALSGMAALAIRRDRFTVKQLVVVPLAILAVVEVSNAQMLDWPWSRFSPRTSSELEALRDMGDGAVIDLALVVRADHENRWNGLSTQLSHGKRTQAVPIERIEYFFRDGYWYVRSLPLFRDLQPLYENKSGKLDGDYRRDLAIVHDAGFRWVVVAYRSGAEFLPKLLVEEMNRVFGQPVARGRGLAAWKIPEVEVDPEELDAWRVEHLKRVKELTVTNGAAPNSGPQIR